MHTLFIPNKIVTLCDIFRFLLQYKLCKYLAFSYQAQKAVWILILLQHKYTVIVCGKMFAQRITIMRPICTFSGLLSILEAI